MSLVFSNNDKPFYLIHGNDDSNKVGLAEVSIPKEIDEFYIVLNVKETNAQLLSLFERWN